MFYAVYKTDTKQLVSTGTAIGILPEGLSYKEYADAPDLRLVMWDAVTVDFIARPSSQLISVDNFWAKFTISEKELIFGFAYNDNFSSIDKQKISAFIEYIRILHDVNITDEFIVNSLVHFQTAGILTFGRKDQILTVS